MNNGPDCSGFASSQRVVVVPGNTINYDHPVLKAGKILAAGGQRI